MADQRITGREAPRSFLDSVDEGIKQKGYEFASSFFALWKSLKMYGEQNEAVKKASDKTLDVLRSFFKTQPMINFGYNGTDIVINDQRLKGKRGGEDYLDMLARLFTSLYVGEIEISSSVTQQDLVLFCQLTRNVSLDQPGTEDTFRRIESEISSRIASMHVSMYDPIEDELPPIIDKPQMARQVYRNLVTECPLFRKKALQKQPLPLKKATRSIQNLVDLLTDDEEDRQWSHLLFLASLDSYQKMYLPTHAANTCILTLATAIHLGIPKRRLTTIGIAAYLHDIGIPDEDQRDMRNVHTELGFAYLSRLNTLNFSMMESAITAAMHHDTYDFRGLIAPPPEKPAPPTPITELIKVCDYYDIASRWWPWSPGKPLSRVNAMEAIFKATADKKAFSATAARALFAVVGIYPPGQVLRVNKKRSLACSLGGFFTSYDDNRLILLSDQMDFKGYTTLNAAALSHLPAEQHYRIPPRTYKEIFQSFQVTVT